MASPSTPPTMSFSTMFLVLFWLFPSSHSLHYDAIFSFGDSLSDTGNVQVAGLPYGMTFFGRTSLWGCHCFRRRRRRVTASGKLRYVSDVELYETARSQLARTTSLFVVGEFGGNDYNTAIFAGRSMAQVNSYVPIVIRAIRLGVEVHI
ncbi:hypothetical protein B296_00019275 [Ensete ventricosum]|uniref:SGNH hydrolase-type esterase domain-containing protein n=1 Tax=Ensete ventricosum TaxID=4639 RepID=A0A426YYS2_ENSVE|nr:hypothetical protein B296_00019275 [Ensete ventricosum]